MVKSKDTIMNKLFYLSLAALTVMAVSCKKKNADAGAVQYPSVQKQWLITIEEEGGSSYSSIYDYSAEAGFQYRLLKEWKDLPDATYLVDENSIYPCAISQKDGVYHLDIQVYGDGSPDVRYYEEFSNVTDKKASFKSVYHDSSHDFVEQGTAVVVEKPVKVVRNPMVYVEVCRMGFIYCTLSTNAEGQKQFEAMAKEKKKWPLVVMDGSGAESDYKDLDVSGKMVAVHHAFPGVGASETGLTPAQKLDIAAAKGAAALILMYTMNTTSSPFTLDQYNTLPKGAKSIPLAIFGSESSLANDNYEIIVR